MQSRSCNGKPVYIHESSSPTKQHVLFQPLATGFQYATDESGDAVPVDVDGNPLQGEPPASPWWMIGPMDHASTWWAEHTTAQLHDPTPQDALVEARRLTTEC